MKRGVVLVMCLLAVGAWAKAVEEGEEENSVGGYERKGVEDPCGNKHCGSGRECDLDEDGKPICICRRKCHEETEARAKVCSTGNVTFPSECEFYRQKCLCRQSHPECIDRAYAKGHMDYYGQCQVIQSCEDWEMEEYPERMRNWFYMVLEELARRKDLPPRAMEMAEEAKKGGKAWVLPVIWKFCDLDKSHDKLVNTRELLPISAPLKTLEHCTGPFLERCDADQSGDITLEEWGLCLGLDKDDIEDQCDYLRE